MDINQQNILNLNSLWKKYGFQVVAEQQNTQILATKSWPYRCWLEGKQNLDLHLSSVPSTHRLSSWPYPLNDSTSVNPITCSNSKWHLELSQTAMYLPLEQYKASNQKVSATLQLVKVEGTQMLKRWVKISSEAFAYEIDEQVFIPLLADNDIEIYVGYVNQQAAVSALLYRTGDTIGLHQVGVKKKYQGQGLSTQLMHQLLSLAKQQGYRVMVLQASSAGLPLYVKFGFKQQFTILHFKSAISEKTRG